MKPLEEFQEKFRMAWGALEPDEVVMFGRMDKELLQNDPSRFMERYHDAIFNRGEMDRKKRAYEMSLSEMQAKMEAAQKGIPQMAEALAAAKDRLDRSHDQVAIQMQKVRVLEEELAVVKLELKTTINHWQQTGKEKQQFESKVQRLQKSNDTLQTELDARMKEAEGLRTDAQRFVKEEYETKLNGAQEQFRSQLSQHKTDLTKASCNLQEQIRELKTKYYREMQTRKELQARNVEQAKTIESLTLRVECLKAKAQT